MLDGPRVVRSTLGTCLPAPGAPHQEDIELRFWRAAWRSLPDDVGARFDGLAATLWEAPPVEPSGLARLLRSVRRAKRKTWLATDAVFATSLLARLCTARGSPPSTLWPTACITALRTAEQKNGSVSCSVGTVCRSSSAGSKMIEGIELLSYIRAASGAGGGNSGYPKARLPQGSSFDLTTHGEPSQTQGIGRRIRAEPRSPLPLGLRECEHQQPVRLAASAVATTLQEAKGGDHERSFAVDQENNDAPVDTLRHTGTGLDAADPGEHIQSNEGTRGWKGMLGAPGYRRQATTTWRFVLAGLLSLSNSAAEVASWNLQEHLRKQRAKQKETAAIQDGEAGKFGVSFFAGRG
ncbi:unnamed protein product [Symbiodinium sp. KB8]|nr:unnamed protein product [Symbiodinium sp. KB8]